MAINVLTRPEITSSSKSDTGRSARYSDELTELLRSRREALGLSQAQVAEIVGCARKSIQNYELTPVTPTPQMRASLAHALSIDPDLMESAVQKRNADRLASRERHLRKRGGSVRLAIWPRTPEQAQAKELIRTWRIKRGMTQVALATELGVDIGTLMKWTSRYVFPVERLVAIERILEMPTGTLTSLASTRLNIGRRKCDEFTIAVEELRRRRNLTRYDLEEALGTRHRTDLVINDATIPTLAECDALDKLLQVTPGTFGSLASDRYLTRLWERWKPETALSKHILAYMAKELIGTIETAERIGTIRITLTKWIHGTQPMEESMARIKAVTGSVPNDEDLIARPGSFHENHQRDANKNNSRQRIRLLALITTLAQRTKPAVTWASNNAMMQDVDSIRRVPLAIDDEFVGKLLTSYRLDSRQLGLAFPIVEAICDVTRGSDTESIRDAACHLRANMTFGPDQIKALKTLDLDSRELSQIIRHDVEWSAGAGLTEKYSTNVLEPEFASQLA